MNKTLVKYYPNDPVILGKIGKAYGIFGWIKIISFTETSENIFCYQPWYVYYANLWYQLEVSNWKHQDKNIIIKLKDINNRDTASKLTNHDIIVNATQLPSLDNGEYYLKDIIGCQVINLEGFIIGVVINFIETISNYIIVVQQKIKNQFKKKEFLIPFIDKIIKTVDLNTKIIQVDWEPVL
ncbi:ribosome maturation factor RimM [Candidatus Pantoea edessiphila]|uniref:Ribosome maturation factor RimM n=1 Tax=Candidatus Pantoea edessiphila TaxID=2044610 RepID=A0A2P5SVM0_9GAMM|nr:ribosome maturation factor RimM [Candidatus Pantoea edessiphila]PPI86375.1 ribosome maturation factor RimM [Candidatus Pantoea edessiphila]